MVLVNASWKVSGHICSTSIASADFDPDKVPRQQHIHGAWGAMNESLGPANERLRFALG